MPGFKYNSHSDERNCGKRVPGELSDRYDYVGGLVCMRTSGHEGDCLSAANEAGEADGVHWCCREKLDAPHAEWCHNA